MQTMQPCRHWLYIKPRCYQKWVYIMQTRCRHPADFFPHFTLHVTQYTQCSHDAKNHPKSQRSPRQSAPFIPCSNGHHLVGASTATQTPVHHPANLGFIRWRTVAPHRRRSPLFGLATRAPPRLRQTGRSLDTPGIDLKSKTPRTPAHLPLRPTTTIYPRKDPTHEHRHEPQPRR